MGIFSRKSSKEKRKIPVGMGRRIYLPPKEKLPKISSREYRIFKQEERREQTWYEKLAGACGRFLEVNPDEKTGNQLEKAISSLI